MRTAQWRTNRFGPGRSRLGEHRLKIADDRVAHRLLETGAATGRGGRKFVEDAAKNQERNFPVMRRFSARKMGKLAQKARRDEVDEDLAESLLLFASGSGERSVEHE